MNASHVALSAHVRVFKCRPSDFAPLYQEFNQFGLACANRPEPNDRMSSAVAQVSHRTLAQLVLERIKPCDVGASRVLRRSSSKIPTYSCLRLK
jgi:hypothetical protein